MAPSVVTGGRPPSNGRNERNRAALANEAAAPSVVVAPVAEKRSGAKVAPAPDKAEKARPDTGGYRIGAAVTALSDLPAASAPSYPTEKGGNAQDAKTEEQLDEGRIPVLDRLPFNLMVGVVTLLNILVLGLEMDMGPGPGVGASGRAMWLALEAMFSLAFAFEISFRIYCGREAFFRDVWNCLDFALVCAACFDTFVLSLAGLGGQVRFFTVLRALRNVRLVRLIRMFPAVRELWLLVGGLVNSVKALGWVGIIVLMVLYVCSIIVTAEIGHNDETYGTGPSYDGEDWPYKKYFGTVFRSMFTLFQVMTLDGWCDDIVRHVVFRQPLMGFIFVIFLFFTAFGLMNVVVGIIVENTLAAAQVSDRRVEERKGQQRREAVERLHEILAKSDSDRSGEISLEELRASCESRIVKEQMTEIGLTMEEIQEIFRLLDYQKRGRVELNRFADSCRELVGGAKRRDLAQVEVTVGALAQHLERLDVQFARIENEVSELTGLTQHFVHNTVWVLTGFDGTVQVPKRPKGDAGRTSPTSEK